MAFPRGKQQIYTREHFLFLTAMWIIPGKHASYKNSVPKHGETPNTDRYPVYSTQNPTKVAHSFTDPYKSPAAPVSVPRSTKPDFLFPSPTRNFGESLNLSRGPTSNFPHENPPSFESMTTLLWYACGLRGLPFHPSIYLMSSS